MNKRPQIKGRGADIYLGSEEEKMEHSSLSMEKQKPAHTPNREMRRMVTTYLPAHLVDRLHQAWLKRAQKDSKAQKAHIITEALERFLDELEADIKKSEHLNIETSEHRDV